MIEHILFLSYGKDSLACLGAIEKLGWPLDRIIHAEIWATCDISADLPPMVEFKKKADAIIKERWGIEVEHVSAIRGGEQDTYERRFYGILQKGKFPGTIKGFPLTIGGWCKHLKYGSNINLRKDILQGNPGQTRTDLRLPHEEGKLVQLRPENGGTAKSHEVFSESPTPQGTEKHTVVEYLGIAIDEPKRLERCDGVNKKSPLAEIGWTEADAWKWCEENDLLSPIYTTATRGGCWFCHNQGVDQLRQLRKNYPDLWALLMKWDLDSPVTFHADGHTVHDFDRRFQLEDEGKVPTDRRFRWKMLETGNN